MSVTLAREVEQDASDAATINRSIQTLRQKLAKRQQDQHPVILDTDEWGTLHLRPKSFSHNTSPRGSSSRCLPADETGKPGTSGSAAETGNGVQPRNTTSSVLHLFRFGKKPSQSP